MTKTNNKGILLLVAASLFTILISLAIALSNSAVYDVNGLKTVDSERLDISYTK